VAFAKTYRGSADEREDVLDAYQTNKGDMNAVMGAVPCCTQVRIVCLKAVFSTSSPISVRVKSSG
jgi:hypothetical protein